MPELTAKALKSIFLPKRVQNDYIAQFFDFRTISSTVHTSVVHWPLYFINPNHRVRIMAVNIVNDIRFTFFILLVILVNSVLLALDDPTGVASTPLTKIINALDAVWLSIFIVEMLIKIVAFGFVMHRYSYLRDPWNVLDFIVVIAGVVQAAAGAAGLNALRVFRVFRPLRSVSRVEALRGILNKLFKSLHRLSDVFALMIFIAWFAAVLGINLFAGIHDYRCYYDDHYFNASKPVGTWLLVQNTSSAICDTTSDQCAIMTGLTAAPTMCRFGPEVEFTVLSFTNIGTSLILALKLISRDNWSGQISSISSGIGIGSFFYFFIVTFFGGYFCLNLFIAVLTSAFQTDDETDHAKKEFPYRMTFAHALGGAILCDPALALCHESRHQGSAALPGVVVGADGAFHKVKSKKSQAHDQVLHSNHLGAALMRLEQQQQQQQQNFDAQGNPIGSSPGTTMQQKQENNNNNNNSSTGDEDEEKQGNNNNHHDPKEKSLWDDFRDELNDSSDENDLRRKKGAGGRGGGGRRRKSASARSGSSSSSSSSENETDDGLDEVTASKMALSKRRANLMAASMRRSAAVAAAAAQKMQSSVNGGPTSPHIEVPAATAQQNGDYDNNGNNNNFDRDNDDDTEPFAMRNQNDNNNNNNGLGNNTNEAFAQHQQQQLLQMRQQQQDLILQRQQMRSQLEFQMQQDRATFERRKKKAWYRWSSIKKWSRTTGWEPLRGLVVSVPYTFFVMAVVLLFAIALSLDGVKRPQATLDVIANITFACNIVFIVDVVLKVIGLGPSFIYSVVNWMDFILAVLSIPDLVNQSSNALSALRAFRLLRLLRVAKQWKSLQRLLSLVLASMKSVASLSLVALIFIYIFAILGFQLFTSDIPNSRFSFTNVFDSLLTVFVIISGENWSDMTAAMVPLYGWGTVFYFVPIFIVGNFFIANLFIAIIIDSFSEVSQSSDDDDDDDDDDGNGSSSKSNDSDDDDDDDDDNESTFKKLEQQGGDPGAETESEARRRRRKKKREQQQREVAKRNKRKQQDDEEMQERNTDSASLPSEVRAQYMGASRDFLSAINSNRQVLIPCDDSSDDEPLMDLDQQQHQYQYQRKQNQNNPNTNNNSGQDKENQFGTVTSSSSSSRRAASQERLMMLTMTSSPRGGMPRNRREENTTIQLANRLGVNVTFDVDPRQPEDKTRKEVTTGKVLQEFVHNRGITVDNMAIVPDCDVLSRAAAREMEHVERIRQEEQRLSQHAVAFVTLSRVKKQAEGAGGNTYGKLRDDQQNEEFRTVAELRSLEEKYEGTHYRSLCFFEPDNKYRMMMVDLLKHPIFNYGILLLILASSILLAFDTPAIVNAVPNFELGITITDYIIAVAFGFEMIIRIISLGGILHPGSYFRHVWNIVDFLVTMLSIIALGVPQLKPVRIIRIVRLTAQTFHMRIVITSVLQALPGMSSVVVFMLFVWWIFAIVGVASFKGNFEACNDVTLDKVDCFGNFSTVVTLHNGSLINVTTDRVWASLLPSSNFDDVPQAFYTLFKVALGDGWFQMMYTALDSPGDGLAPVRNSNLFAALYFVVFTIVGNFFIINLFTGVLADRFVALRQRGSGYHLLSEAQKQWVLAQRVLFRTEVPVTPACPTNPIRRWCFYEVQTKRFDYLFTFIIVVQAIQLSMYTAHMNPQYETGLDAAGIVMLCLFTIEILMKMLAFNPIIYWRTTWNQLDLVIVALSWVGVFIGNQISIIRVFRVFRLVLLLRKLQGIQTLFIALYQALPELINVGVVLAVVYTIFAVIGVALFSNIPATAPFTELINFRNVGSALITLYVCMTTDGWDALADKAGQQPPDCDPAAGDCGNRGLAYFYFILYMFVMAMILVNLLVTVVLGNFKDAEIAEEQETLFQVIQEFRDRWAENDLDGSQKLDVAVVLRLLPTLPPAIWDHNPLKVRGRSLPMWIHFLRQLQRFHIPIGKDHSCTYRDVIASLALRLFCVNVEDAIRSSRTTSEGVTWDEKLFSIHHHFAALKLSRVARRFIRARGERLALRQLREIKEQHTILIEAEYVPLRRSHEEAVALARFALKKAADAQSQATELRRRLEELTSKIKANSSKNKESSSPSTKEDNNKENNNRNVARTSNKRE